MSDILDQSDIDALLSAVDSGDVNADGRGEAAIFSRHRRGMEKIEIKDYDFKRPERISKDQMRALADAARDLCAQLRRIAVRLLAHHRRGSRRRCRADDLFRVHASLPNPTSFNLVESDELDGQLCLEISPLIIYPIIDRLLGGSNHDVFIPQRAMTLIETRLIQKILDRGMAALREAWESVKSSNFRLGDMESNPQIVQIVPPNEVVVVIGFEIKTTNRAGTMSLCIPFNVIEPLIDDLSAQSWVLAGKHGHEPQWGRLISQRLADASLEVSGVLAHSRPLPWVNYDRWKSATSS
jgi:flagellar motor switch protein FliM